MKVPVFVGFDDNNTCAKMYRYGFNGKEKDNETYGDGSVYDYGFRIYNPRLGKFLSVDPLFRTYPFYTPYQFASNMPIKAVDIDGLESNVNLNECENAFINASLDYDFSKHALNSLNSAKSVVSIEVSGQALGVGGGVQVGNFEIGGSVSIGEVSASVDGNGNSEVALTTMSANAKATFFGYGVSSGASLLNVMIWNPNAMKNNSNFQEVVVHGGVKTPESSKKAKAAEVENRSRFDDFTSSLSLTIGEVSATIKTNFSAIGEAFKEGYKAAESWFSEFVKFGKDRGVKTENKLKTE